MRQLEITETAVHIHFASEVSKRRESILTWIIVILVVLWLLGYFAANLISGFPRMGNLARGLLVIAVILIVLTLLRIT